MTNIIIYSREILISFQFNSYNYITHSSVMSLFRKILNEFKKLNYNQNSRFSEYEINKAVDQLCSLNANVGEFDRAVAEQLWQHSTKTPQGTIILKDYIQTIIDARLILQQNIDKATKQLKYQPDYAQKQQLQECLISYSEDYKFISEPFNLQHAAVGNLSVSGSVNQRSAANSQNASQIFTDNTSTREESTSLKVVLIITIICIGAEIICMFAKHHFFNILCYLLVIAIFALNYFDQTYIKLCEVSFGVSILFDLIWLITHSGDYWSPSKQTQFSHLQNGLLKFIVILTVLLILCKILIGIVLFRFTKNTETTAIYIKFLNKKIQLTGSNPQSPFEKLLKKSDKNYSKS